jgi:hypothetical protein
MSKFSAPFCNRFSYYIYSHFSSAQQIYSLTMRNSQWQIDKSKELPDGALETTFWVQSKLLLDAWSFLFSDLLPC